MNQRRERRLLNLTHLADGGFDGGLVRSILAQVSSVEVSVLGSHLGDFWSDNGGAVALVGISCVVVVVFLLSDEEVDGLFDGGHDRLVVHVTHVGDHGFGLRSLLL